MIFFSDDNSEMGFFNNQDLNSDINSENNNLLEDQYMKENWDNNEEKNFDPNQKNDLNSNKNDFKQKEFKHNDEKNGDDFILKEPGIYNDKIEKGRNPINKENGGVFPEIKHNQESYIKISENEKQEEEKEKIQELEEKNKKQKQQRDKYKEYSKLILHIRTAITKYWKNLIKKR